jgi:transcription factor C subunit 7
VDPHTGVYSPSLVKTPTGIPTDPPLTSKGVDQSKELAQYLAKIDPPVERIYSSPFYRCLQTLKPFTDALFKEGKAVGKIRIDRGVGYVNEQRTVNEQKTVNEQAFVIETC